MAFHNNPRIVTRGLIFCADANDGHNASGSDGDNGMVNLVTNTTNARNGTPVVATLGGAKCFHFATASNGHYYEKVSSNILHKFGSMNVSEWFAWIII